MFSIGTFYLTSVNNASQMQFNAGISSLKQLQLRQSEDFKVISTTVGSDAGFYVNNTGPVPIMIISTFVSNTTKLLKAITTGLSIPVAVGGSTIGSPKDTLVATSSCTAVNPCVIKVVTKNGNSGVALFPVSSQSGFGGALLSTTIVASPSPVYEGSTVTVNVTVSNFASSSATNVLPVLSAPVVTGTASVSACTGVCPVQGAQTIAAGNSKVFTYHYVVHTGGDGGTASFVGYSSGTIQGTVVSSSAAVSPPIQIGGFAGSLIDIGPFSLNYFYFKYTDIQHQALTSAGSISISDTYVAFYVQLTNNYNQQLKILEYSYLQLVRTGPEQNFFIVKSINVASHILTAYTDTAATCPGDPGCITLNPGTNTTLIFGSFQSSGNPWGTNIWTWSTTFPGGSIPEADSVMIVIVYLLGGVVYAQAIPFQALVVCSGAC